MCNNYHPFFAERDQQGNLRSWSEQLSLSSSSSAHDNDSEEGGRAWGQGGDIRTRLSCFRSSRHFSDDPILNLRPHSSSSTSSEERDRGARILQIIDSALSLINSDDSDSVTLVNNHGLVLAPEGNKASGDNDGHDHQTRKKSTPPLLMVAMGCQGQDHDISLEHDTLAVQDDDCITCPKCSLEDDTLDVQEEDDDGITFLKNNNKKNHDDDDDSCMSATHTDPHQVICTHDTKERKCR